MLSIILRIAIIIFMVELIAMLILDSAYINLPAEIEALLDAVFLTLCSSPIIYWLVIKPFVQARMHAETELREINNTLEKRILKRTEALEKSKQAAEQASRYKSEFLSRMSHELRTPLTAILGYGQMLEMDFEDDADPEHAREINEILLAGNHLLALIDEVLDLARIENGRISIAIGEVPFHDTLEESINLVRPLADKREILFVQQFAQPEAVVLQGDQKRVKEVFTNILSNAVKYNQEGGSITIATQPVSGQRIRINFSDTGIGLSEEQCKSLFTPFERLGSEKTKIEGTGIGLYISKKIVELMGGDMGCHSTPGQGSTFWVELNTTIPGGSQAMTGIEGNRGA